MLSDSSQTLLQRGKYTCDFGEGGVHAIKHIFLRSMYLFLWLHRVVVAACRIFIVSFLLCMGSRAHGLMWYPSSLTRDEQPCIPYIARWILNHWTIRQALKCTHARTRARAHTHTHTHTHTHIHTFFFFFFAEGFC